MMRKLKGRGGFSLAETLLATLILLLVGLIMTTGIPAAKTAYEKVVLGSNAQVLLSTAVNALRDELGTAWEVTPSADSESITYFSANTGTKSVISLKKPKKADGTDESFETIYRQEFAPETADPNDIIFGTKLQNSDDDTYGNDAVPLISGEASTADLYVTYEKVEKPPLEPGVVTFTNLSVCRKSNNAEIAKVAALKIRVVSETRRDATTG